MIEAIIFDADGVVINYDKRFSERLAAEQNIEPQQIEEFFDREFTACVLGKADLKKAIEPYLEKWHWTGSVDSLLKFWFEHEDQPNKKLIQFIKELKSSGIKCYLATNQEKYRAQYLADKMGFLKLFDYLFFSYEMHRKKPDQAYFDYIWESLGYMEGIVNKRDVMYWDDQERNVKAATAFGFHALQYTDLEAFQNQIAHFKTPASK